MTICSNWSSFLCFSFCHFEDCLLRGPQLPGPPLGVQQWLHGHFQALQLLQLHPGQWRSLGGLPEAQLHGVSVHSGARRVPRLPQLDGFQQLHPLLPDVPPCKSIKRRWDGPWRLTPPITLNIKSPFKNGCQSQGFWCPLQISYRSEHKSLCC